MRRDRKRLADSTLPLVWGVRTLHSFISKPASLANSKTRATRRLLPPCTTTSADMLSVSHSAGTPPRRATVRYMHRIRSSVPLLGE